MKISAAFIRAPHFQRLERTPLLGLGKGFDKTGMYVAPGAVPGDEPDTYWFYYVGTAAPHDNNQPTKVRKDGGYGRFLLRIPARP